MQRKNVVAWNSERFSETGLLHQGILSCFIFLLPLYVSYYYGFPPSVSILVAAMAAEVASTRGGIHAGHAERRPGSAVPAPRQCAGATVRVLYRVSMVITRDYMRLQRFSKVQGAFDGIYGG